MQLAVRVGRVDVDRLLHELSPEQFEEHWAAALLDGWGGDSSWLRIGAIASEVHNLRLGRDRDAVPTDWLPTHDHNDVESRPAEQDWQPAEEMEDLLRKRWG